MSDTIEVRIPDIGGFKDVPVIEVLVKAGDHVKKNDSLIVLESEKASMEVPSTADGVVQEVAVKAGDNVGEGTLILTLTSPQARPSTDATSADVNPADVTSADVTASEAPEGMTGGGTASAGSLGMTGGDEEVAHASPGVRRFARELGVDMQALRGSGPHGRITRDDVQDFVKASLLHSKAGTSFAGLPPWPTLDFARYGAIERKPLSRIKRLSGPNLHRNWLQIPHITNYDEADVTDLEAFRIEVNAEQTKTQGLKLTLLAFLIRASVAALQLFPEFNSSLDGDDLVYKHYYNVGFAADTPNGLVVPVLANADAKGLLEIARETAELAAKARAGKLALAEMQGGTFTISSIGGIGGTAFTQIVNAPEVAILGAVRAALKPVWNGSEFRPRLMLPISVSYDHRVVDGAGAARFLAYLSRMLSDFRRVLL